MHEITILSGKGGTGKTSIAAALMALAENAVLCDCDVDAANLYLLLNPDILETHPFQSGSKAWIDPLKCNTCGICMDECRFNAIHCSNGVYKVDPFACEGCHLCKRICPVDAITIHEFSRNKWFISDTRFGPFVHARMSAGEENSGRLVSVIRKKARELSRDFEKEFIITDGPPGIGCPVISSLSGTQMVLMVIEPSLSGIHDARRLFELTESFDLPSCAIINKYNLSTGLTKEAEAFLTSHNIPLLARIPFDENFTKAMVEGKTLIEYAPGSESVRILKEVWLKLKSVKGMSHVTKTNL